MLDKEFAPYQESLELKELGFDEPCFGYYDNEGLQCGVFFWWNRENKNSLFVKPEKTNNPKTSAPTFSQAFRWFREKYGIVQFIIPNDQHKQFGFDIHKPSSILYTSFLGDNILYYSHEEAELVCLRKLIEIVKRHETN